MIDDKLKNYRLLYRKKWRNRSDLYWYWRSFQEFIELGLSLIGLHKDHPSLEKSQIAGIMANWMEYRNEIPPNKPKKKHKIDEE